MAVEPRVQIKLRGQRFEMAKQTLLEGMDFFQTFFAGRVRENPAEAEEGTGGVVHAQHEGLPFTYERKREDEVPLTPPLSATGPSMARDLFDFGPMTPEFFGAIIASLRKGRPTFDYDPLGFEQQKVVADHVRFFGVRMLAEKCKAPTAPPPRFRGDDDDDLEMPECGCEYCGTTEHATAVCPRRANIMLAAQTLAIANAQEQGLAIPAGCEAALARAARDATSRTAEDEAAEAEEIERLRRNIDGPAP